MEFNFELKVDTIEIVWMCKLTEHSLEYCSMQMRKIVNSKTISFLLYLYACDIKVMCFLFNYL